MAARADNLGLVGDSFAMSAAVFGAVGSGAATGSVGAFLGVSHGPPLAVRPEFRAACPVGLYDAASVGKGSPSFSIFLPLRGIQHRQFNLCNKRRNNDEPNPGVG